MTQMFTFPVHPTEQAVSQARRRVAVLAKRWHLPLGPAALKDLELCASEVLTNALRHTRQASTVRARWTGSHIRIEVSDAVPCALEPVGAGPRDEGGRGLLLVEHLAACWGTEQTTTGKVVWFEIAADTRRSRDDGSAPLVSRAAPSADR
jgi:anti-sigma regulatory factor (Ser/Thr protein kinase)